MLTSGGHLIRRIESVLCRRPRDVTPIILQKINNLSWYDVEVITSIRLCLMFNFLLVQLYFLYPIMICLKVIDTLHVSHSLVEGRHYKEDVNVTVWCVQI